MSRFGSEYRAPRDRSRSPPRFSDRRPSVAGGFDARPSAPHRNTSDAPRGPRTQFDSSSRGPPAVGLGPARSLREAPPLGSSGERGRPYRERDYDRRERLPSPRERSPPRAFKDPRDLPPRDLDINRARRASRDGPPSAGSTYSDNPPFSSAPSFRGGFGRGRGRGDFEFRGGRGGRRALDDRDSFRRGDRSPPRYARDISRDEREPDRRDDRRFDRRDDDRRSDWLERDRELDRSRRDPPAGRVEHRASNDSLTSNNGPIPSAPALPINPERLAILEESGADISMRRPPLSQSVQTSRESRRDIASESPAYLNGRAETTAHRYGSRGSSPPTLAPPSVPAFSFSVAQNMTNVAIPQAPKFSPESKAASFNEENTTNVGNGASVQEKPVPPLNAPTAPKVPPAAPKAHLVSSSPAAPKAPRALDQESVVPSGSRLQGVRSMENLAPVGSGSRPDALYPTAPGGTFPSPASNRQSMPSLAPVGSANTPQSSRFDQLPAPPTGPRAARASPGLPSAPLRPPLTSPRSESGGFLGPNTFSRAQTPPLSAPLGPRRQSSSVSPKATYMSIPTAPKASRVPPSAPRAAERAPLLANRVPDRPSGLSSFAPTGPRNQWNQWRRPAPAFGDKINPSIPAKRDATGEEKDPMPPPTGSASIDTGASLNDEHIKAEQQEDTPASRAQGPSQDNKDQMDVDDDLQGRKSTLPEGHSAAQSFFGKAMEKPQEEMDSSSEEDELDDEEDATTLLEAKHAREERETRAQMLDLSSSDFRATTPLESIARIARISARDLQRFNERGQEMDIDEQLPSSENLVPPAANSSESDDGPEVPTPRGDHDDDVEVELQDDAENVRRVRRRSPELINLPYLIRGEDVPPLHEDTDFKDNIKMLEEFDPDVLSAIEHQMQLDGITEENIEAEFKDMYFKWRQECEELDWEQEEAERLERQVLQEPGPDLEAPAAPSAQPMEGRRLLKFSSEYEMERVIKESEETARIEQEKLDREAKKVRADMEKEARVPDQDMESRFARSVLIDTNRHHGPDDLTWTFTYQPPKDTFTDHEQQLFKAAFKDTPKKWGEIASLLPGRSYKDCIHHYYANKWNGKFRDNRKLKGRPGRGRGGKLRGRGTSSSAMADMRVGEESEAAVTSESGRPRRAAAPTTFGEREIDSKNALNGPSPAKKAGPVSRQEFNGEAGPVKRARQTKGTGRRGGKAQQVSGPAHAPMSPGRQAMPDSFKDEMSRLQDASLLTNFSAGQHGIARDTPVFFNQEGYHPQMGANEEAERPRATASSSKQSASSYWSVPEQQDFTKYIEHFGTDFGAIALHMGTKTQTMIKNHYQRQIDGGRSDLEQSAVAANARRERGEDIGPPPTPTPIVKRKYDPQTTTPRTIAPHSDAMDTDEPTNASRPAVHPSTSKHTSPPQYLTKPRFPPQTQTTPIQAQRVVPSPTSAVTTPVAAVAAPLQSRLPQHSMVGPRPGFLIDSRSEPRPGIPANPLARFGQEPQIPLTQAPPQPGRAHSAVNIDPQYLHNIQQEQQKALKVQDAQQRDAKQLEQVHQRPTFHPQNIHGSPLAQPLHVAPLERKPPIEERAATPPRGVFPPPSLSRPMFGQALGQNAIPLGGRTAFNPSPARLDNTRPGSVPSVAAVRPSSASGQAIAPPPAPVPTPAKRSNVMSLLNDDPEPEPKPEQKRDSLPSATTRVASPAPPPFPSTSTPQPLSGIPPARREPAFGQASLPTAHFHRATFASQASTPGPQPQGLKVEPLTGGSSSSQQPPAPEWPSRLHAHSNAPSPPNAPPLERDVRPYFSHRNSALGALGQPNRANPSPPPHGGLHSRTPSLSTQPSAPPPRDHRPLIGGQSQGPPQPGTQILHTYGPPPPQQQQVSHYAHATREDQNRAHHAHNTSVHLNRPMDAGHPMSMNERIGFPPSRVVHPNSLAPRDDALRRSDDDRAHRERHELAHPQYELDRDRRIRVDEMMAAEQTRRENQQQHGHGHGHSHSHSHSHFHLRQQEQEMERARQAQQQHAYASRGGPPQGGPPPSSAAAYGSAPFAVAPPSRAPTGFGMREEAFRDANSTMQEHLRMAQAQQQEDVARRRQQQQEEMFLRERDGQQDAMRRAAAGGRPPQEEFSRRGTPQQQQHFGYPPPPAQQQQQQRR